eukprot:CAMPEP_0179030330 /NCGR_PEP_ID=MMETSP0796-20121207/10510_1 /TAXON_ID=73915 /ORGANISM="Pyrodinium bahamense, Strain pbaha01" /LENGTH=321 /DNA_ID=CAMNT_0020726509 /DNA_START=13 /DNA_END=975 /DNA_ORIENTATION=-
MVEQRPGPCPRLLDFGLARLLTRRARPRGGSFRWAAPEVFGRSWTEKGGSVDVFSVGRIAYFATTQQRPLEDLSEQAVSAIARSSRVPALNWPASSPLIDRCKSLTEQATRPDPAMRPVIEEVHRELASWPESKESLGSQRSGHEGGFWQLVHAVRESMDKREQRRKQERIAGNRPAMSPAALPAVPETSAAPSAAADGGKGGRLALADFKVTPDSSMKASLSEVLYRWNFPLAGTGCCVYHMAVAKLRLVAQMLDELTCKQDFQPWSGKQCPSCHLMFPPDESASDEAGLEYDVCAYCGHKLATCSGNSEEGGTSKLRST